MEAIFRQLPGVIQPWYQLHKRPLPWREDKEPYHIWLSEIMLQQTRVEAVRGYYTRFLEALPTIEALAAADEEPLLKLWEGLGYYSRVRNLQKAAKCIVEQYGGVFPKDYKEVLALPGIGTYTAGAICSIAFDQPTPAVDGNVLRVVSRLTADATPIDMPAYKQQVQERLAAVYPAQAGDFTQALMELGATVCGPNREPNCASCPCKTFCRACQKGIARDLPVRLPKKARRAEEKTVFLFCAEGRYALQKRPSKGLLAGLWQFPEAVGMLELPQAMQTAVAMGVKPQDIRRIVEKNHIFTHIEWKMRGYYMDVEAGGDFIWLTAEEIDASTALPTAYRQFWEDKL